MFKILLGLLFTFPACAAQLEMLALDEATPQIVVPQVGDSYLAPVTLNAATGNEVALELDYTVNKASSGNDTGLLINMTDTASPGTSLPVDIQVGGSSKFSVDPLGSITQAGAGEFGANVALNHAGFRLYYTGSDRLNIQNRQGLNYAAIRLDSSAAFIAPNLGLAESITDSTIADVVLSRDAANTLAQRNGTNAQEFRIYNTDNGADDEFASLGFINNSNVFTIENETAGAGTDRLVAINDTIYGILSTQGNSTTQEDIGTTPEILTSWNTNGLSNGMTVDHTDDSILATVAGTYEVNASISFSGTGGSTVDLFIYVYDNSGTSWGDSGFQLERKLGTGGDVGNAGVHGIIALDTSDKVALYITTDGATDDITVTEAQLMAMRISD